LDRGWIDADFFYLTENNGIDMEMEWAVHGTEAISGSGGNVENRKMFSHREHGFPLWGGCERRGLV
jgi:hypothetical protein